MSLPKLRKKVVIFIVEGESDKAALKHILNKIYKRKKIVFCVTDGDLSSSPDIDKTNVELNIRRLIHSIMHDTKIKRSDIWQIVHIFDTDGAFIPDENIMKYNGDLRYTEDYIMCRNKNFICERNHKKADIMNYLLELEDMDGYPYKCFFMSSNLDHALYNIQNLEKESKIIYADRFMEKFIDNPMGFIEYIENEVSMCKNNTYESSWKYIKQDTNSLKRNTNLNIYFENNPVLDF